MAKKTKVSEAVSTDEETFIDTALLDAASITVETASSPSGLSVPDGTDNPKDDGSLDGSGNPVAPVAETVIEGDTHTPQSASGAAAGEASAEPVKPLTGSDPIEATVAETDTPTFVSTSPEVEAAASGTNSESSSQETAAGDAGANAGVSAALTQVQADAILAKILGVTIRERREFIVYSTVRYNNVFYAHGGKVIVDQDGHAELAADNLVAKDWLLGRLVEG